LSFLNTIEGMVAVGFGLTLAPVLLFRLERVGCAVAAIVPIAAWFYAQYRIDSLPPETLRSTSALEMPFAALWAGCGSILGWYCGQLINARRPPKT